MHSVTIHNLKFIMILILKLKFLSLSGTHDLIEGDPTAVSDSAKVVVM